MGFSGGAQQLICNIVIVYPIFIIYGHHYDSNKSRYLIIGFDGLYFFVVILLNVYDIYNNTLGDYSNGVVLVNIA